jgi:hypothetical protein
MTHDGRPPKRLNLLVIFGQLATFAYEDGLRSEEELKKLGRVVRHRFDTLEERNAYIQGVDEATGFLHSLIVEES